MLRPPGLQPMQVTCATNLNLARADGNRHARARLGGPRSSTTSPENARSCAHWRYLKSGANYHLNLDQSKSEQPDRRTQRRELEAAISGIPIRGAMLRCHGEFGVSRPTLASAAAPANRAAAC
jgi:hypothetical protein